MAKEPDLSFFEKYKPAKGKKTEIKREKIPAEPNMKRIHDAACKIVDADAEAFKKLKVGGGKGAPPKTGFGLDEEQELSYWPRFGDFEWDLLKEGTGIRVGSDDEESLKLFVKELKSAIRSNAFNDQLRKAYKDAAEKRRRDKEEKDRTKPQGEAESKPDEKATGKANPAGKPKS